MLDPASPRNRRLNPQPLVYAGLYVLVVLLPLHVAMVADPFDLTRPWAVEFAVALGFLTFAMMWMEFVLVSRLRTLSDAFGTDTLVQFHRMFGIGAAVFLLGHVLLLLPVNGLSVLNPLAPKTATASGAIAFWALLVLTCSSLWRRRLRMSFDIWNRLHRWLGVTAAIAATVHVLAVSGYSSARSVVVVTWLLALFAGAVLFWYAIVRPLYLWRRPWRVVENRELGGDVHLLTVRPEGHPGFRFEPGQFSWLITGRTPFSREQHPITIASGAGPADAPQSYAIKRLGNWSGEVVPALEPGDRLWVEGPYGALSVDRLPAQGFVLIGGGIGITPMLSIIQTLLARGDRRPVVLFYAANDLARTICREQLAQWQAAMDLKVVYVLERPAEEDVCERGRLSAEILRRHLPPGAEWFQYLICGPNPMMDAAERLLGELGVPSGRIHSERFDQV